MRKEEKGLIIDNIADQLKEYGHFYLADTTALNAADTSSLRRKCFNSDIKLVVVKNTLLKKALQSSDYDFDELYPVLKGTTAIMFSNTANAPAKLIKEFRKDHDKPLLKAAFVYESVYVGDNLLDTLVAVKSKEDYIGELIALLQSPAKNVVSALQSGGNIIHGVLKTLGEKEQAE